MSDSSCIVKCFPSWPQGKETVFLLQSHCTGTWLSHTAATDPWMRSSNSLMRGDGCANNICSNMKNYAGFQGAKNKAKLVSFTWHMSALWLFSLIEHSWLLQQNPLTKDSEIMSVFKFLELLQLSYSIFTPTNLLILWPHQTEKNSDSKFICF